MLDILDGITRELTLFAAVGLLVGGLDDGCVDLLFLLRRWRRGHARRVGIADLPPPRGGTLAVLVPAWDEAAVIGGMLRAAIARFDHPDYRLYVGVYPNDPSTIAAVAAVAATDTRVRAVVGERPGPTTKADCLNALWRALLRDEAAGTRFRAIVARQKITTEIRVAISRFVTRKQATEHLQACDANQVSTWHLV